MMLRAWDREANYMLQHKQVMNVICCSDLGYDIFEDGSYHIMPYINMLDYQGTQIFVGDIIGDRFSRSTGVIYEVVEITGGYGLIPFKNGFRHYAGGEVQIDTSTKYKLIGNIYQNKKILDIRVLD